MLPKYRIPTGDTLCSSALIYGADDSDGLLVLSCPLILGMFEDVSMKL